LATETGALGTLEAAAHNDSARPREIAPAARPIPASSWRRDITDFESLILSSFIGSSLQ
jgi:hypothetical protein